MPIPEYTGGDSSGSSTGTTTSAPSAPAGPSEAELAAQRNLEAAYRALLQALGIPMSDNVNKLIKKGMSLRWNMTTFQYYLRKTKDYHEQFPGNMNKDGTVNLSEAAYITRVAQYKDAAARIGMKVSPKVINLLIKKGISPSYFAMKAEAVKQMRQNKDLFEQFKEYLTTTGVTKKPPTKGELLRWSVRQGPKVWDTAWDTAYAASQLAEAGIDVGKPKEGADISYKGLQKLQGFLAPGEEPDYAALAEALQALPPSQLYGYGLNKKKVATLAFGGPNARAIAETATRALAQYRLAVTEPGAQPQFAQSQTGTQVLTGRRAQQATE